MARTDELRCRFENTPRERRRYGVADLRELVDLCSLPGIVDWEALEHGGLAYGDPDRVSAAALLVAAGWV